MKKHWIKDAQWQRGLSAGNRSSVAVYQHKTHQQWFVLELRRPITKKDFKANGKVRASQGLFQERRRNKLCISIGAYPETLRALRDLLNKLTKTGKL